MAVCGLLCINLNYTLKILDTHFSYNEKLIKEKNKTVTDIHRVIKKMENEKPYTRRENCYF